MTDHIADLSGRVAHRVLKNSKRDMLEETVGRAAKRIRLDEAKPLKKSGLRNQHQECEAVLDAVQGALDSLADKDYKRT